MYKVQKNKDKKYEGKRGLTIIVPKSTEYSIYYKNKGHNIEVFKIPDYFIEPEKIAKDVVKLMNTHKLKLKLDI